MRSQRVNCRRAENRPGSGGSFLVTRARETLAEAAAYHQGQARRSCASGGPRAWRSDHVWPNIFPSRRDCGLRRACACHGDAGWGGSGAVAPRGRRYPGRRCALARPTATWVEQELPRQLAEALSGRLTPKGATLVVRIDSLTIGPNKDDRAWDNISGVAMVGSVQRPVRATSRYWASAIDQALIEQSNHARVSAVVRALAFWIARDV
jgi:hypothetical protein